VEAAKEVRSEVGEIDAFVSGDINWLDELYELSKEFPPAEKAIVDTATFTSRSAGGGQMLLEGHVTDSSEIRPMEESLRGDGRHEVYGDPPQPDDRQQEYPWKFKERIVVPPTDVEEFNNDE
jgi:hypothetical protein